MESDNVKADAEVQARTAASRVRQALAEKRELTCGPAGGKITRTHTLPRDSAARKEYPIYSGVIRYFPAALAEVARVSKIGNDKHNPGQEMHHARGKSMDHADCQIRHMIDGMEAGGRDENGVPELAYKAWRALAELQEWLEQNDGAPLAPGAKLP